MTSLILKKEWESELHLRIQIEQYWCTPGHAVAQLVEALLYKPEGRGFDSR